MNQFAPPDWAFAVVEAEAERRAAIEALTAAQLRKADADARLRAAELARSDAVTAYQQAAMEAARKAAERQP